MIPRDIQSLGRSGGIKNRENSFDRLHQVRPYVATVTALVKPLQPPMFKDFDRQDAP